LAFSNVLDSLCSDTRAQITSVLRDIESDSLQGERMVENLERECRVDHTHWEELCEVLADPSPTLDDVMNSIIAFCRDGRQLSGGPAEVHTGIVMGRVVARARYCSMLVEKKFAADAVKANQIVETMIGVQVQDMPAVWREFPLGEYIIWSAFDPEDVGSAFPVHFVTLAEFLCRVGLEPGEVIEDNDVEKEAIVFEYRLPDDLEPFIPCFFDAYAASGWPKWFRPAPAGRVTGLTWPPDACENEGYPEVVHEPLLFQQLARSVRSAS